MKGDNMTTKKIKRTDEHRPSAIEPVDYELVNFTYAGSDPFMMMEAGMERGLFTAHMKRTGGRFSGHEHAGGCDICGAYYSYGANFYHSKSNTYIGIGWICAEKLGMSDRGTEFRSWKKRIQDGGSVRAGKAKAAATVEELGLSEIADIIATDYNDVPERLTWAYSTLSDMYSKLVRYGTWSEKQVTFARNLVAKFNAPAPPPPNPGSYVGAVKERREFEITIAGVGGYEGGFGYVEVYIMKDADDNTLIWKTTSMPTSPKKDENLQSYPIKRGTVLKIKGTVKEHAEYKGVNQTILTRVVILEDNTPDRDDVGTEIEALREMNQDAEAEAKFVDAVNKRIVQRGSPFARPDMPGHLESIEKARRETYE